MSDQIKENLKQLSNYYASEDQYKLNMHFPEKIFTGDYKINNSIYEKFFPNQLYGLTNQIRFLYGNLTEDLRIIFPHGMSHDYVWVKEFRPQYPICVYSYRMMSAYLRAANQLEKSIQIKKITFPILSIARSQLYKKFRGANLKNKVLIILSHSLSSIQVDMSSITSNIITFIAKNCPEASEINLLLYWKDYITLAKESKYKTIKKYFTHVFCCGHHYDPLFSSRCASILSYHDSIVTDHISTPSFICAALGKELLFLDNELIPAVELINEEHRVDRVEREKRRHADISLFNRVRALPPESSRQILNGYIELENTHQMNMSTILDLINHASKDQHDLNSKEQTCIDPIKFFDENK